MTSYQAFVMRFSWILVIGFADLMLILVDKFVHVVTLEYGVVFARLYPRILFNFMGKLVLELLCKKEIGVEFFFFL